MRRGPRRRSTWRALLNLGPYAAQDHVSAGSGAAIAIAALDMADAELEAAQNGRQVQLNLGATIPGLTNATAYLAIGQRPSSSPWIGVDNAGTVTVRTAQARLYIDTQVAPAGGLLAPLGVGVMDVPVYIELAQAEARALYAYLRGGDSEQFSDPIGGAERGSDHLGLGRHRRPEQFHPGRNRFTGKLAEPAADQGDGDGHGEPRRRTVADGGLHRRRHRRRHGEVGPDRRYRAGQCRLIVFDQPKSASSLPVSAS